MAKEVIYLDIEDDITSAIGKFKKSASKIVALVPPKRTAMLTSLVNLRLLKKAADDTHKKLVLITSDETLRNLAGGLGIYVAKNLTTAPEIPAVEAAPELPSEIIEDGSTTTPVTSDKDADSPQAASDAGSKVAAAGLGVAIVGGLKKLKPIKKEAKQLPNFEKTRKRVVLALFAFVLLIGGVIWAQNALPHAVVNLRGQTSSVALDQELRFSTNVQEVDAENKVLPAERKSVQATQEVTAPATGEKNIGAKATGEITVYNCSDSDQVTFKAGTRFASGDFIFTATQAFTVDEAEFQGGNCDPNDTGTGTAKVVAEQPGDSYNLSARSYDIVNVSNNYTAQGSNMTGGTTELIKVVTEEDVEAARAKLEDDDLVELEQELATQFEGEVVVLTKTITTDDTTDQVTPNLGDQATDVKIVRTATYSVFAVDKGVYENYVTSQLQTQIGEQQAVIDSGIDEAIYALKSANAEVATLQVKIQGLAGPDVDVPSLQQQLTGQGYTEGIQTAESLPGILKADIELSPFWASKMPKRASNIEINLEVAGLEGVEQTAPSTTDTEE